MSQKTIAVSFIGKGKKHNNVYKYDNVTYDFTRTQISASVFCDAVLQSNIYDLTEYIIIGTTTSSWHCLLDDTHQSLKKSLEQQSTNGGVSEQLLLQLQQKLQDKWNIKFGCHICPEQLDENNVLATMYDFFTWLSPAEYANAKIVLDITHGFRSLSTLIMSAIQLRDTLSPHFTDLEIIYGELNNTSIAPVRRLKPMWEGIQIAKATELFFDKFDASKLCHYLQPFWPDGVKALHNLSLTIQANLILRLDQDLNGLENSFASYPQNAPKWSHPIFENIKSLHKRIATPHLRHQRILAIAKLLKERSILGQAVIALQLSYETFLFVHFSESEDLDGSTRYNKVRKLRSQFESKLPQQDRQKIKKLHHLRNSIAHGGNTIEEIQDLHREFLYYESYLSQIYNQNK